MNKKIIDYMPLFLVIGVMIIFFISRFDNLFLPCYWDEAFPYCPAVYYMYENGISLLPTAMPTELYRGHPLLFYVLQVIWMDVFGGSLYVAKIFPLLISLLIIFLIYYLFKDLLGEKISAIAAVFTAIQPVFIAQSTFLLPEMMLTLFTILTFYSYMKGKKGMYLLFCTLLLLTKETGLIFYGTIIICETIVYIYEKKKIGEWLSSMMFISIPLLPLLSFFVIQKYVHGWFFFPLHVDLINFDDFINRFFSNFNSLLINEGKVIPLLIIIVLISFRMFKRMKIMTLSFNENKFLLLSIIFLLLYMIFYSANFHSPRYKLSIIPFIMMAYSILIVKLSNLKRNIALFPAIISCMFFLIFDFSHRTNGDSDVAYEDVVVCHEQMALYLNDNHLQKSSIFTHFIMQVNLKYKCDGYMKSCEFEKVTGNFDENTEYCIFSNVEYDNFYNEIKLNNDLKLLKRFENHKAYCELYKIIK